MEVFDQMVKGKYFVINIDGNKTAGTDYLIKCHQTNDSYINSLN